MGWCMSSYCQFMSCFKAEFTLALFYSTVITKKASESDLDITCLGSLGDVTTNRIIAFRYHTAQGTKVKIT